MDINQTARSDGPVLQKKTSQNAAKNIKVRDQFWPPKIYSYTHKEVDNRAVAYQPTLLARKFWE